MLKITTFNPRRVHFDSIPLIWSFFQVHAHLLSLANDFIFFDLTTKEFQNCSFMSPTKHSIFLDIFCFCSVLAGITTLALSSGAAVLLQKVPLHFMPLLLFHFTFTIYIFGSFFFSSCRHIWSVACCCVLQTCHIFVATRRWPKQ